MTETDLVELRNLLQTALNRINAAINQPADGRLAHLKTYTPAQLPMRARELYHDIQAELKASGFPVPNTRQCAAFLEQLGYRRERRPEGIYWTA